MNEVEHIIQAADRVPSGIWLMLAGVVAVVGTWRLAGRRMRHAGERSANPQLVVGREQRTKDTALTVAAMVPAVLFWAMVLAWSFRGLVAFGRGTMRWTDGWEYLVPGSLDGVSVTFALLAFRAVRKQKAPDRCYRVVWVPRSPRRWSTSTMSTPPAGRTWLPVSTSRCSASSGW